MEPQEWLKFKLHTERSCVQCIKVCSFQRLLQFLPGTAWFIVCCLNAAINLSHQSQLTSVVYCKVVTQCGEKS